MRFSRFDRSAEMFDRMQKAELENTFHRTFGQTHGFPRTKRIDEYGIHMRWDLVDRRSREGQETTIVQLIDVTRKLIFEPRGPHHPSGTTSAIAVCLLLQPIPIDVHDTIKFCVSASPRSLLVSATTHSAIPHAASQPTICTSQLQAGTCPAKHKSCDFCKYDPKTVRSKSQTHGVTTTFDIAPPCKWMITKVSPM